jgi:hypothetical protein
LDLWHVDNQIGVYRECSETMSGNNQASKASVIAMYSHWRLVLGGTRSAYGPTTDASASTLNQKLDDLSRSSTIRCSASATIWSLEVAPDSLPPLQAVGRVHSGLQFREMRLCEGDIPR